MSLSGPRRVADLWMDPTLAHSRVLEYKSKVKLVHGCGNRPDGFLYNNAVAYWKLIEYINTGAI